MLGSFSCRCYGRCGERPYLPSTYFESSNLLSVRGIGLFVVTIVTMLWKFALATGSSLQMDTLTVLSCQSHAARRAVAASLLLGFISISFMARALLGQVHHEFAGLPPAQVKVSVPLRHGDDLMEVNVSNQYRRP